MQSSQLGRIVLDNASTTEDEMRVRPVQEDSGEDFLDEIASRLLDPAEDERRTG